MKRKRTIEWEDPAENRREAAGSSSGLEYLTAMVQGRVSHTPVAKLVGYQIERIEKGRSVYRMVPEEYHYNPYSTVHGGILATLLDSAMTSCVLSTLPEGFTCTTIEFKINFIRPATDQTGALICTAVPLHVGKQLATVQGDIRDKQDRIYAHGTSTCKIFEIPGAESLNT